MNKWKKYTANDDSNNYDVILSSNVLPINEWQQISCVGYYDNTNSNLF